MRPERGCRRCEGARPGSEPLDGAGGSAPGDWAGLRAAPPLPRPGAWCERRAVVSTEVDFVLPFFSLISLLDHLVQPGQN